MPEPTPFAPPAVYAWITRMDNGVYALVGANFGGLHQPLISHDRNVVEGLRPFAEQHRARTGQPIWFVEYAPPFKLEELP